MNTEDRRIVKTKTRLLTALKQLLREKSFEDITVSEICDRAKIRRATFYKYFDDKYAFLKFFVGSLREEFDASLHRGRFSEGSSSYYTEYLKAIVGFLTSNVDIVKNMLESEVLHFLVEVIREKNYEDTSDRLQKSLESGMKLPASVSVTSSMMTGAVAATLLQWFKGGRQMPEDKLVEEMSAVIVAMQKA